MADFQMICETCGVPVPDWPARPTGCGCDGPIGLRYELDAVRLPDRSAGMWDYAGLLPLVDSASAVTLGEGATPLLPARSDLGCAAFWKVEAQNPTGSQKDRALSVAVSRAAELGFERVIIASTGGAGLSCAAYCARAGLACLVLVPEGTPPERLLPIQGYGARIVEMAGTFRDLEDLLTHTSATGSWFDATTRRCANPFHPEGPKTIAYEIVEQMGGAPDWVIVPVGGGATLYGIWRGFEDYRALGRIAAVPRLVAVQARAFNALEVALRDGLATPEQLARISRDERVPTILRNLKHGLPPDAVDALRALRASRGLALSVTDDEALAWQGRLGATEGILAEPSSAVVAVALERLVAEGAIGSDARVVAVVTGSALREIATLGDLDLARVTPDAGPDDLERLVA